MKPDKLSIANRPWTYLRDAKSAATTVFFCYFYYVPMSHGLISSDYNKTLGNVFYILFFSFYTCFKIKVFIFFFLTLYKL